MKFDRSPGFPVWRLGGPELTVAQLYRVLFISSLRQLQSTQDVGSGATYTMAHVLGCFGVCAPG
jgi:hypothetical protein